MGSYNNFLNALNYQLEKLNYDGNITERPFYKGCLNFYLSNVFGSSIFLLALDLFKTIVTKLLITTPKIFN